MSHLFKTRRDHGAVIPLVALLLPVVMIMTAFAIDLGSQRSLRRTLQADADVIALDLVRLADGRTTADIEGANDPVQATAYLDYLNGSLRRNDRPEVTTLAEAKSIVVFGRWDETTDPTFTPTGADEIPNSVEVTFDGEVRYRFQPGTGGSTRRAEAATEPIGSFSIGSRLASLDTAESELLGPLLGRLLGSPDAIDLSAGAYDGLVNTNVSLGELFDIVPLEVADVDLSAASPDQILATEITALEFVNVVASALEANSGDGVEAEAALAFLDLLRLNLDPTLTLTLGEVLDVGVSEPGAVADVDVNLFDLLNVGAQVANGDNLVDLPVDLDPDVVDDIPVVNRVLDLGAAVRVGVIEPPQVAVGPVGTQARTSQIRIIVRVTGEVEVSLQQLLQPIPVPDLLPSVARVKLDIPLTIEVANGRATLTGINCNPTPDVLDLAVATSAARVLVGHLTPGDELLDIGSTTVSAADLAVIELLGIDLAALQLGTAVQAGMPRAEDLPLPVGTSDVVEAGELGLGELVRLEANVVLLDNVPLLGSVLSALLDPLVGPIASGVLNLVLNPLLGLIDSVVVRPLLDVLGVGVAGADVSALDADCASPILVG
jgi:uncharacterized membrane protein